MRNRLFAIITAGALGCATALPASAMWVASWVAPPHAPLATEGPFGAASYDNVTLSQILRVSEGGEKLRIKLEIPDGAERLKTAAELMQRLRAR